MELEGGPLYQWDTGRKVKSDAAEVHFATQPYKTYDVAVKDGAARVPDELLQRAGTLRCWAWTGSRTLEAEAFEVTARNRPASYAYEPTTQREIADAVRAKEDAEAARDEAQGFAATAKGHADAAASKAQEATERAGDCEAAEGRAQDAANAAAGYAERAKASADAASASAETVAQGIGDEAKARADADARLAADLAAETAGRKADTQGALEERARIEREYIAADRAFDNKLNGLSNALSTVGGSVNKAIAKETADRKTADTELGTKLSEDMAAINANLGTRIDAVASVAPLVVKVEDNVPAKTFGEMQSAMLAGRPVYWTDGLLTFAAVQMEHGGLRARVGLNVSGGAITSATFWELAPNADAITESSYSF